MSKVNYVFRPGKRTEINEDRVTGPLISNLNPILKNSIYVTLATEIFDVFSFANLKSLETVIVNGCTPSPLHHFQ